MWRIMSRLINADTLPISSGWIEQGNQKVHITFAYEYDIQNSPTVDAIPVVHGHWIYCKGSNGKDYRKCSVCLHTQEITGVLNYCPICGTRMGEVVE